MDFSKLPPKSLTQLRNALASNGVKLGEEEVKKLGSRSLDFTTQTALNRSLQQLLAVDPGFQAELNKLGSPQTGVLLGRETAKPQALPPVRFTYSDD